MNQLILLNEDGNPIAIVKRTGRTKATVIDNVKKAIRENTDLHELPDIPEHLLSQHLDKDVFEHRFLATHGEDLHEYFTIVTALEY